MNMTKSNPIGLRILALSSMILLSLDTALAQQPVLEEIVVTAEKREQSLQDVSSAITAMSAGMLDAQQVSSPEDLNALVPGLTISKSEGFRKIVTIRGFGFESAQNDVANQSVSYHVDGVYIASDFSLHTDFIDVERIEVLRGPQGTLFGQNSTAGTINVVNKKPSFDGLSGKADLTLGSYNTRKIRSSINLPFSQTIATRISLVNYQHDGYTENVSLPGFELDQALNTTARIQVLWQPSDIFSAILAVQYFKRDGNGAAQRSITDPGTDVRKISHDYPDRLAFESEIYSAILEWNLSGFTIKSLTSFQDELLTSTRDNDRSAVPLSIVPVTRRAPKAFTQEINIVSDATAGGRIDWVVGGFLLASEQTIDFVEFIDSNKDGIIDETVNLDNPFSTELGFATNGTFPERDSFSVYGQATFSLTDALRILGGARYTKDKLTSRVCNFFCDDTFVEATFINTKKDDITGKIGLEWDLGSESLLYASYSQGFKPGGANLSFFEIVKPTFLAESVDAYEVGSKNRFLDSRLQLNLSAFFYAYKNYQFQTSDPQPFSGGVDNIPKSESQGLEVEYSALLGKNWRLDGHFTFLDTKITSDFDALDAVLAQNLQDAAGLGPFDRPQVTDVRRPAVQNIKGHSLPKAPKLSASAILSHFTDIDGRGALTTRLHYVYRSKFQYRVFANSALDTVPSYDLWNLSVLWQPNDANWTLEFIASNLGDKDIVNSRFTDNFGVNNTSEEFIAPRQFLVRAGITF